MRLPRPTAAAPACLFCALQINATAAGALTPDALGRLFTSALRCSGPDAQWASAAGAARAILDAGVLGCDAHRRRHPAIAKRPPYDEFRWELYTQLVADR